MSDRKESSRRYYEANKERIKSKVREYRLKNQEEIKKKKSEYLKKVRQELWWKDRHTEKRKKQCKNWRKNNEQRVKQYNKKYKSENSELCSKIARRRISSKRGRTPKWLTEQHKQEIDKLTLTVKELNKAVGYRAYHLDHIIPLNHPNVSGLHVPWNLQILTASDNSSKNNKFDGTYNNESWRNDV
jgi:hypothetical protein